MIAGLTKRVLKAWDDYFDGEPILVRSPGRINLIGEHTDYNDGYVFPAAIDRSIVIAIGSSGSDESSVVALDPGDEIRFSIDPQGLNFPSGAWENYVYGVVQEIQVSGYALSNFNLVFAGNIPLGAGLSSSAALENGIVFGLNELFELDIPKEEMILISQRAEHNFAGVQCGIMDQYISMFGKEDHALLIDCRSMRSMEKPLHLDDCELILINSNVKHSLASSAYNERREECHTGVAILQEFYPDLKALRDITLPQLEEIAEHLPPVIYDRCAYVVKENARVLQSLLALESRDLDRFGQILSEAHEDMRYLYEITCEEIDHMVDTLSGHSDVLGCRMMGGGFGGCTLNLIRKGKIESVVDDRFRDTYNKLFGLELDVYQVEIADGTKRIWS